MEGIPFTVTITLLLMPVNALVWLSLGIVIAFNAHPALPDVPMLKWFMAWVSFTIAGMLVVAFVLLRKHNHPAYTGAIGLFALTIFLTLFDQFGLADLIVLLLNLPPLVLLIKDRSWYLGKN